MALGQTLVTIISVLLSNRVIVKNLNEKVDTQKVDLIKMIESEKRNALELARLRIGHVEKDVDEIYPRLRSVEIKTQRNCDVLSAHMTNKEAHNG